MQSMRRHHYLAAFMWFLSYKGKYYVESVPAHTGKADSVSVAYKALTTVLYRQGSTTTWNGCQSFAGLPHAYNFASTNVYPVTKPELKSGQLNPVTNMLTIRSLCTHTHLKYVQLYMSVTLNYGTFNERDTSIVK